MHEWCMIVQYTSVKGLSVTNNRIEGLMADFSGLNNLEKMVDSVLRKLQLQDRVQQNVSMVKSGSMSMQEFDGWFSELVRAELGKVLGIQRANAVRKAREAGAGSAQGAVMRRMYKDEYAVNINIAGHRGRMSRRDRLVEPPTGGKSGIRRPRTVKERTMQLRKYYGPDRDFILRILEGGRDVFMATPEGPTGRRSMATYGKRGAMTPRNWFFHSMKSDMEQAAQQLGQTLTGAVEKWVEQQFTESTK
jgi:hypothetical protein